MIAADKARAHEFRQGDFATLSAKNIHLKTPGKKKLCPAWLGPFKPVRPVGSQAFQLELPPSMKIHDVFHVSLLRPYKCRPGQAVPAPVTYDGGDAEYEIECVLSHRNSGRTLQYLVKWSGYSEEHNSWEPASSFDNAVDAVQDFWQRLCRD